MIHLDFESYSKLDLKAHGHWRYAADPSTVVLCIGFAFDKRPAGVIYGNDKEITHGNFIELFTRIRAGEPVKCFGAFERAITELVAHRQWGMPIPRVDQWRDTQALCLMCALPASLGKVAEVLQLPADKQKDKRGKALIRVFCMPTKKFPRIFFSDKPQEAAEFREYCCRDVETERAVWEKLPIKELPGMEQKVWEADSNINRRGIKIDRKLCQGAIKIASEMTGELTRELIKVTNGEITSAGQHAKIKAFCNARGGELASTDADAVEAALADMSALAPEARRVLEIRQGLAGVAIAKYQKMLDCASPSDDRVRGIAQYHGARPGRWAGRFVQFQNIPRPVLKITDADRADIRRGDSAALSILYDDVMIVLRDAIRNAVIAPNGKVLTVGDLTAIEPKGIGWLAGDPAYLNAYRDKRDLYCEIAAVTYGKTYAEIVAKGKKSDERQLGKVSILQLQYGAGFDTPGGFLNYCKNNGITQPYEILLRAFNAYRSRHRVTVQFWYALDAAAGKCILTRQPQTVNKVTMEMVDHFLTIKIPSGRRLWFPFAGCQMIKNKWGYLKPVMWCYKALGTTWTRTHLYGSIIAQNLTEAVCRDLIAAAMLKCEARGLPVCMSIHDELVCETDTDKSKELEAILDEKPSWGLDFPLGAECFASAYYKK